MKTTNSVLLYRFQVSGSTNAHSLLRMCFITKLQFFLVALVAFLATGLAVLVTFAGFLATLVVLAFLGLAAAFLAALALAATFAGLTFLESFFVPAVL